VRPFPIAGTILFLLLNAAQASSNCVKLKDPNWDQQFEVSGTVTKANFWGPPNFGEEPKTDLRYSGWMLHLDQPIRAHNSYLGPHFKTLRDIQVRTMRPNTDKELLRYSGRHVVISGRLNFAETAADQTTVVLWPIRLAKGPVSKSAFCLENGD
jgi:hypothetical protein